jgi:hypothetical protein
MGRANNSFSSYVGHAEETINLDKVSIPEKDLWIAVLCRASLDAFNKAPSLKDSKANRTHRNIHKYDREQARHFFREGGFHFNLICEMAGRNPSYIQEKATKLLLQQHDQTY